MTYTLQATFKSGKMVTQEVTATDTAEAMILFATRPFIQEAVTNEDGEEVNELVKIEIVKAI